ncbi:hypothetical protein HPB48_018015 [Haemaphysalis longicornis]|uniref:Uncharacterized protein n=1 Tax=Haemaphysalis longicornis TaxID=44386 RepID=A0A9J6FHG0_HAELO|nr:hypothetical protein HPB48_018015 [Haemaphysalis longicornis]
MVPVGGLVPAVAVASASATSIPLQDPTRLDALRVCEKTKPGNGGMEEDVSCPWFADCVATCPSLRFVWWELLYSTRFSPLPGRFEIVTRIIRYTPQPERSGWRAPPNGVASATSVQMLRCWRNHGAGYNKAIAAAADVVPPASMLASTRAGQHGCWWNNNGAGGKTTTAAAAVNLVPPASMLASMNAGGTTGQGAATTPLPATADDDPWPLQREDERGKGEHKTFCTLRPTFP